MKTILFFTAFLISYTVNSQQIQNVEYFLENKNILITYDLVNCTNNDLVDISIEFVEQSNQKIIPKSLSGDIKNVGCGRKKIVWNINNDNIELNGRYQAVLNYKISPKGVMDGDGSIEKLDAFGQEIKEMKIANISKEVLIEKYVTTITNTTSLNKAVKVISKIKTLKRETELTAPQIPMPIVKTDYLSQNDKETMILSMSGNTIQKSVFNGEKGYYEDQRGKTPMSKESIDAKKKVAGILPEVYFAKNNVNYELLGIEVVNGKDAYLIKYSDGIKETYDYFDVATFYKIRSISTEEGNSQTFNYGDFKQVNGIYQPNTISIEIQGLTLKGIVKNIEINGKIDSSIFE